MHLLYLDESGSAGDKQQKHFVLAGISVFERQGYWIANELDKIAEEFNPADPLSVELHGSPIYGGKRFWREHKKAWGTLLIKRPLAFPMTVIETEDTVS